MSTQQGKNSDAPTIGVGNLTSGEAGATPDHETMAETGGSGGEALTKPHNEESEDHWPSGAPNKNQGDAMQHALDTASETEGADTAATATARGAQDTRSRQAGINPTGLGTPETGGNQSEGDLAPPYQK